MYDKVSVTSRAWKTSPKTTMKEDWKCQKFVKNKAIGLYYFDSCELSHSFLFYNENEYTRQHCVVFEIDCIADGHKGRKDHTYY